MIVSINANLYVYPKSLSTSGINVLNSLKNILTKYDTNVQTLENAHPVSVEIVGIVEIF